MGGDDDVTGPGDSDSPPSPSSPSRTATTTSGSAPVVTPERLRVPTVGAKADGGEGGGEGGEVGSDDRRPVLAVVRGSNNGNNKVLWRRLDNYIPAAGLVSIKEVGQMCGISLLASDSIRYASIAAAANTAARAGDDSSTPGGTSSSSRLVIGDDDGGNNKGRPRVVPGRCGCTMLIHGDLHASSPHPLVMPQSAVNDGGDGGPPPVDSGATDTTGTAAVVDDVDGSAPTASTYGRGDGHSHTLHPHPPPLVLTVESVRDVVQYILEAMHKVAPTRGVPMAGEGEDFQTKSSVEELILNGRDELLTSTGLYGSTDGHLTYLRRLTKPMTIAVQGCQQQPTTTPAGGGTGGGETITATPRGGGGVVIGDDGNNASESSKTQSSGPNGASSTETMTQRHQQRQRQQELQHSNHHHCQSADFSLMDVLLGIDSLRETVFKSLVENLCRLGKKRKKGEDPPPSSSSSPPNDDDVKQHEGGREEEDASKARLEDEVRSLLLEHVRRLCRVGGDVGDHGSTAAISDKAELLDVARKCLSTAVHGEDVGADLEDAVPELFKGVYDGRGGGSGKRGGRKRRAANGGGRGRGGSKRRLKGMKRKGLKGKGKAKAAPRMTRVGTTDENVAAGANGDVEDEEATDADADADADDGGGEEHNDHDGDDSHDDHDSNNDDDDLDDTVTEDEDDDDADPPPPVRVTRHRELKVPSSSGMPSPPSPSSARRRLGRLHSVDESRGEDDSVQQPPVRRSSRRHVPKDRTPDGGMMYDSTTMSREDFEAKTRTMNQTNAYLRKVIDPGRSRPSLECLSTKLSDRTRRELVQIFFSRNGSLRREIRDDIDFSMSNDPKYINFGNGDENLGREDRRYQIGLRKHPLGGKTKTRERVEEIFSREGVISPLHESLDDIGILVGGTEDQTLHHDVARQFVTWYETIAPLTPASAAEAESGDDRVQLDGWEIDRVAYNDAMSSPHAPSSILIGMGDSGEVLLGVQKDQVRRSSPTERTCTIIGGCGKTYRIVRENEHIVVIVVPVGCMFTGDFPHCGVRNFRRGTMEDELLVRFNDVISAAVNRPSRSRLATSKAVIEMLCNFPALSGLCRLHCSTRMNKSDIMIPINTIGYADCWQNERDGRCYDGDEV